MPFPVLFLSVVALMPGDGHRPLAAGAGAPTSNGPLWLLALVLAVFISVLWRAGAARTGPSETPAAPAPTADRDPVDPADVAPHLGQLAICGIGKLGRVTGRAFVTYPDHRQAWAWVGITAQGAPWSSRTPRWLHADDIPWTTAAFGAPTAPG